MKIRFYRGPWDGKVRNMNLQYDPYIRVAVMDSKWDWLNSDASPQSTLGVSHHTYRRTRHTHPDGSVFYEWDQPKGTKWKK